MRKLRKPYFDEILKSWVLPLTRGRVSLISFEDLAVADKYNWCYRASPWGQGYAAHGVGAATRIILLHRVILHRMGHEAFENVDHINGNGLDNRRCNLRPCTTASNMANRGPQINNASGFKGVSWSKTAKAWHAFVNLNKKRSQAYFKLKEDAIAWVRAKREELHGEFARHE